MPHRLRHIITGGPRRQVTGGPMGYSAAGNGNRAHVFFLKLLVVGWWGGDADCRASSPRGDRAPQCRCASAPERAASVEPAHASVRARLGHRPAFVERVRALLDPRSDVHHCGDRRRNRERGISPWMDGRGGGAAMGLGIPGRLSRGSAGQW